MVSSPWPRVRPSRRRVWVRRGLITGAALAVLLLVADTAAKDLTQYWMGRDLATAWHLPERPSVSLSGFPFLLKVASGEVPTASVRVPELMAGPVTLQTVDLELVKVGLPRAKLLTGHHGTITAAQVRGTAEITAASLAVGLGAHRQGVRVRFSGGRVLLAWAGSRGQVTAQPSVAGHTLTLRPVGPRRAPVLSVTLPALVEGIQYTSVAVGASAAVVSFHASNVAIQAAG